MNLISIETVVGLEIERLRNLKMSGDITKHNSRQARHQSKAPSAGREIDQAHAYFALGDFFRWFHYDITGATSPNIWGGL